MGTTGHEPQVGLTLHQWMTAVDIASDDITRTWQWGTGPKPMIIRLILLALGQTAVCTKSAVVSTDPEQLALLSGTEPEAAVAAVQTLLHDNDPLIVPAPPQAAPLAAPACWLRIPQNYREAAAWIRWRAKSVIAAHPVFLMLGPAAGFTYTRLSTCWDTAPSIAKDAKLSYTTASRALKKLQDHELAVSEITRPTRWDRRGRCWRLGPIAPDEVAQAIGASRLYEQRFVRYAGDAFAVRWPYNPGPTFPYTVEELAPLHAGRATAPDMRQVS
jgi:hypothetical protein